ncbi:MAG TPA: FkbM family methyltransferase [Rhizobiales bacterium]|nr:FkbM family methyltransferase [Hyphomicrobiales bacterium]
MSIASGLARLVAAAALPASVLSRAPSLRGTRFLAAAALRSLSGGKPFQMVNVGACDGLLFDDVTPWLHRIRGSRAVLVEPIPYNQKRLRANYPDTERFVIEPVAVTGTRGTITVHTFDAAALEAGTLPIEFIGCSSVTDTNLMSGKNAWGEADANFARFAPHLKDIEVPSERLQTLLDRNGIDDIDAFLVDCEGADWIVLDQLDLARYRPGMIKIEVGALPAAEIGQVVVKLKTAGYQVGFQAEDVWAFA